MNRSALQLILVVGCSMVFHAAALGDELVSPEYAAATANPSRNDVIDGQKFWSGRPVWLDADALRAAHLRGRALPPLPFDDPLLGEYLPTNRFANVSGSPDDSEGRSLVTDALELAFWSKWTRLLPKPPDEIETEQQKRASEFFEYDRSRGRYLSLLGEMKAPPPALPRRIPRERLMDIREEVLVEGFPSEAFTSNALLSAYVVATRTEYGKEQTSSEPEANGHVGTRPSGSVSSSSRDLGDGIPESVAPPPSAWRMQYLRRLLQEDVADEYVHAYCTAWGIDETELTVSGGPAAIAETHSDEGRTLSVPPESALEDKQDRRVHHRVTAIRVMLQRGGVTNLKRAQAYADRWGLDLEEIRDSLNGRLRHQDVEARKLQELRRLVRDGSTFSMHQAEGLAEDMGLDLEAIVQEERNR